MKQYLILTAFILTLSPSLFADNAAARLMGTKPVPGVDGTVTLEETESGLKIKVEVNNAPDGKHGLHIHENGSCAGEGQAAGGHFNPGKHEHGDVMKQGVENVHPGDLGNIEVQNGQGLLEVTVPNLTLSEGDYAVLGKSIILHEKEDDFSQPTGNAGGRIACGVIEKAEESK